MAGYSGCSSKLTAGTISGGNCAQGTVCSIATPSNLATTFNPDGIAAYSYTGTSGTALTDWTPNLPSFFSPGDVKAGTDVIFVQRASSLATNITGNTVPNNANVRVVSTSSVAGQIGAGDVLMVSDCKSADVIRVTNQPTGTPLTITHSSSTNSQNTLTHAYGDDAEVMKLISRVYYIRVNANGEPALARRELRTAGVLEPAEDLVDGIEEMRLTFGEDLDTPADNVPNIYRTANNVSSWSKVVSVRVALLARTLTNVDQAADTRTYSYDNASQTIDPVDNKHRRQFYLSTIQVRN